ncbi:MAG: OmpA family protein [Candidatus Omnitrophica bacterium]|nr:OmpA family protein [Candidatus Omnitrophota bacterium]
MRKNIIFLAVIILSIVFISGCGTFKKKPMVDHSDDEKIMLQAKLRQLQKEKESETEKLRIEKEAEKERLLAERERIIAEKEAEIQRIEEAKALELSDKERKLTALAMAKSELETRLQEEIGEYKAKLEMTERGLVITFLAEIFFDSGKAVISATGEEPLEKVAAVLNGSVPNSAIAVEGHTDNDPIKHSAWESNWELSSARALAVLHYLIDKGSVKPERLSAVGYGEYRPVASNDTPEGKQENRRVEIVILPSALKKVPADEL